MKNPEYLYLKFGREDHLKQLQTKGLFYCNTVHYFTEIEDDGKVRGDKDETCVNMNFLGKGTMTLTIKDNPNKEPIQFETTNAHFKEYQRDHIGNMYCLSTILIDEIQAKSVPLYDIKCNQFGSHVLFINNSAAFMSRIEEKLNELKLPYEFRTVEYQDLSRYSGEKSLWLKDKSYEYQKERRIMIKTELKEPFIFEIGNIEDLSALIQLPKDKPVEIDYAPLN